MSLLISFVGLGRYDDITHILGEKQFRSPYSFIALAQLLDEKPDLFLFFTPEAEEAHGDTIRSLTREYGLILHEKRIILTEEADGEKLILKLLQDIPEGEEIILDITHSYRYLPFIIFPALLYLQTLRHTRLRGVYYAPHPGETPITSFHDLSHVLSLVDVLHATHEFVTTGRTQTLERIKTEHLRRVSQTYHERASLLTKLTGSLVSFSDAIATARGREVDAKLRDVYKKILLLQEQEEHVETLLTPLFSYLTHHLPRLYDDPLERLFEIVRWSIERGNIQQGLTILLEGIITLLIRKYAERVDSSLTEEEQVSRDVRGAFNEALNIVSREFSSRQGYAPMDRTLDEKIIGYVSFLSEPDPSLQKAFYSWLNSIKEVRNDINHAGWRVNAYSVKTLKERVTSLTDDQSYHTVREYLTSF